MREGSVSLAEKGPARWLLSVGLKFLRVVPFLTITVVVATVISEASLLLAFLLPIKVIILVGADHVPAYFPSFLAVYDKADLIPALALCAIGFYLVHQLGDRVSMRMIAEGTTALMARSRKITLFENQNLVAERAFQRYATMLANTVFVALSLVVMWVLYPAIAVLLVAFVAIVTGVGVLGSRISSRFSAYLSARPGGYANLAADIGFLLAFSFMILDYLRGSAPSVLICIVGIILTRQAMRRSASLVVDVHSLLSKRLEISALFFHGQSMKMRSPQTGYWSMLQPPDRERWLSELLTRVLGEDVQVRCADYRQLGVKGVVGFIVDGRISDTGKEVCKLIKVFNSPLRSQAQHEATLLADRTVVSLPAPNLISVDLVEGFQAHVFDWHGENAKTVDGRVFKTLKSDLSRVQPPDALMDQFKRSRPMLWDRLDSDDVRRLGLAVTDEAGQETVERFAAVAGSLKTRLKNMPLQFVNLGQSADTITIDPEERILSIHWGSWSLEPFGSGLLSAADGPDAAREVLDAVSEIRSDLVSVSVPEVQLTSMVFEFVQLCGQQRYRTALEVLCVLMDHYDASFQDSEAA